MPLRFLTTARYPGTDIVHLEGLGSSESRIEWEPAFQHSKTTRRPDTSQSTSACLHSAMWPATSGYAMPPVHHPASLVPGAARSDLEGKQRAPTQGRQRAANWGAMV
eukprot:3934060-Rhodomonas_salina.8